MKNKFFKRLGEAVFGHVEPEIAEGPAPTESLINAEPPPEFDKMKFLQKLMRRRAPKRKHMFRNKAMTRGVQASLERAQRPGRLSFIHTSMRQGVEAAARRRRDYLKRKFGWEGRISIA